MPTPRSIFLNLPVRDLDASRKFFEALGFTFNEQFTDEDAACLVMSDTIYAMLMTEPFFKTFTDKKITDTTKTTEALLAISFDRREDVDTLFEKAIANGAKDAGHLPKELDFMYSRNFEDLDGHTWELFWMDPAKIEKT